MHLLIKNIPHLLILIRLLFACIIILLVLTDFLLSTWIVLSLMYAGILSDIFDGIIARKLNISTENLRLLDTFIDLLFYIALLIYILSRNPLILSDNLSFISIILFLEGLMYAISLIRFKKIPSPHAILSKFWGIYLVIEFTLLLLDVKGVHFKIALLFGILAHVDRVLIYSFLREWDHDIPSTFHALQLRAGKSIKRRKLFNG